MKIGIDARFYGTENTGLGRYTLNYLQCLFKLDRQNDYFILLKDKPRKTLKAPSNFTLVACSIPHYSFQEQLLLPKLIKSLDLDIFHSLHFNAPIFSRTPLVVTIHDLIKSHFTGTDTTTRPIPWFIIKRLSYNLIIKNSILKARAIIVPSKFVANDVIKQFPSVNPRLIHPISEAPDPVFTKKLSAKAVSQVLKKYSLPAKSYILFVGNAYPHKNLKVLIKAMNILNKNHPSITLTVVSKPFKYLESLLSKTKPAKLKLIANVSDTELHALYLGAISTVTPSLMEGFGLVGIESLAVGTPVIASDIPVYREVYGQKVQYFPPHDALKLANLIEDKLNNPNETSAISKEYTWENLTKSIIKVYDEVGSGLRQTK